MAQVHRNQLPPETKKDAPAGKTVLKSVNLNEDKGVLMYGATGQDAYGPLHYVSFYSKNADKIHWIADVDSADDGAHINRLRCGAFCGDKYYGYKVKMYTYIVRPLAFVTIDFKTGKVTTITDDSGSTDDFLIYDMTYDYSRHTCWALASNPDDNNLSDVYKVNLTDGSSEKVASLDFYAWCMAADYDGNVYVIKSNSDNTGSYLTQLDPNDSFSEVESKELKLDGQPVSSNYVHTMEFDHNSNTLYWLGTSNDAYQRVYAINPVTGSITKESTLPNDIVVGLYIPFEGADSRDAAGKVTDLKAVAPDDDEQTVNLSWTNPSVNWRGDSLEEFKVVTVSRDRRDNVVNTIESKAGEKCTWTDNNPEKGVVTYYLTPYRQSGEKGLVDSVKVFVGSDVPGNVGNLTASVQDKNVALSWDEPTASHTGKGYDKASLKYDIIRNPGNETIKSDLTGNSYVDDNLGFFDKYSYTVVAKNKAGVGDSTTSAQLLAGKGYEPTFFEDFDDAAKAAKWQTIDNNYDGKTFAYSGGGYEYFKDFRVYLSYYDDLDDYLVSPPVHLLGGHAYRVSALTKLGSDKETHKFAFTMGTAATADAQKTVIATHDDIIPTQNDDLQEFADVFTPAADGDYYLSVHCMSPKTQYGSYFAVRNFKVEKVYDNDLAVTAITPPSEIVSGKEAAVTVKVMNAGSKVQNKYKVTVADADGDVLSSKDVDETIESQAYKDVEVPVVIDKVGTVRLYAKVTLDGDEDSGNDISDTVTVKVKETGLDYNVTCKNSDLSQSTTEPMTFFKTCSTIQTVYTSAELGQDDGVINGMAFQYTPNDLYAETEPVNVKIYMGTTDSEDLYTTSDGWVNADNLTLVYDGQQTVKTGGTQLMDFIFTTPFNYDHTKNLLVQVWKEGTTTEMFPALFDIYGGENWQKLRMLRYNGADPFDYTQSSYPVNGKPVALFSINFANGIAKVATGKDRKFVVVPGGLVLNEKMQTVEVYDASGRKVAAMSNVSGMVGINVNRGLYLVRMKNENGAVSTAKIVLGK